MSGHAAVPDAEDTPEGDLGGEVPEERDAVFAEADGEVIEENEAEAAADEHAEDAGVEDEVCDAIRMEAEHALAGKFSQQEVGEEEAGEVGEAVVTRADGTDFKDVRIEAVDIVGEGVHEVPRRE